MVKRLVLLIALAVGLVSTVAADVPWPTCLPCPKPPASN